MLHLEGQERIPPSLRSDLRWERTLAQGSGGSVELCHHLHLKLGVVLKWAVTARGTSEDLNQRFRREARLLSQLSHPRIVRLLDSGEHDGMRFLLFEYIEGPLLADVLASTGILPWREALSVALQMAEGLAEIHAHGILHRDVKPLNTVMHESRGPVLIDFGLVRAEAGVTALTAANVPLGTPAYVAPEIALATGAGPAADVYSLGIVLHEMLAGRKPFAKATLLETLEAQVSEPPPEIPDIPPSVANLVKAMLAKKAVQRPADGAEVVARIRAILEDPTGQRDSERITIPAGLPTYKKPKKPTGFIFLVPFVQKSTRFTFLLLFVVAVAVIAWGVARDGGHAGDVPAADDGERLVMELTQLAGRAEYEGLARDLYLGRPVSGEGRRYLEEVVAWLQARHSSLRARMEDPATPVAMRWKLYGALSPFEGIERTLPEKTDLPRPAAAVLRSAFIVTKVSRYRNKLDDPLESEHLIVRYVPHENMLLLPGLDERALEIEMEKLTHDRKDVVTHLSCEISWSPQRRARRLRIPARCQGPGSALDLDLGGGRVIRVWGRGKAVSMEAFGDVGMWISGHAPMLELQLLEVALPPEALEPGTHTMTIRARVIAAKADPKRVDCVPSVDWVAIDK